MSVQQRLTRFGTVTEFDEPMGLGVVTDEAGVEHPFHCTAIADGSRDIAVGTPVSFRLAPARGGRHEAVDLQPR
ncbi:MAG: cold shock domain-containing protein [Actinomycetia bacterium]|nr:cold shock domain-containing protein [Actinomycetes bacterium]